MESFTRNSTRFEIPDPGIVAEPGDRGARQIRFGIDGRLRRAKVHGEGSGCSDRRPPSVCGLPQIRDPACIAAEQKGLGAHVHGFRNRHVLEVAPDNSYRLIGRIERVEQERLRQ